SLAGASGVGSIALQEGDPGHVGGESRQPPGPQRPNAGFGESLMRWGGTSEEALYWLKALGITLFLLMFMVWQRVEARHLERQVSAMRKEEDQLLYQNAHLQSQINQWLSPSHLESVARKELGMVPLDAQHRIGVQRP